MRKLLFLPFVLFTLSVLGQQQAAFEPSPPTFIVTLQLGTDTVRNGIDTVKLTEETVSEMSESDADTNYVVTLTPKGDCGLLSLLKLNRYYFIIKQEGEAASKAVFEYIVFAKQPKPWMPMQPPHPPAGR